MLSADFLLLLTLDKGNTPDSQSLHKSLSPITEKDFNENKS